MKRMSIPSAVVAAMILLAACGDDEGGDVRTIGDDTESGSASGSATGSASGVAAGEGECEVVDGVDDPAESILEVAVGEWFVRPTSDEVPAGVVRLSVENQGAEPHELVIVRGVAADDLPVDEQGALDEEGLPEGAFVGEIEPFASGASCEGNFAFEAGDYTLICNIVEEEEDGTIEAHLAEGMVTEITVT